MKKTIISDDEKKIASLELDISAKNVFTQEFREFCNEGYIAVLCKAVGQLAHEEKENNEEFFSQIEKDWEDFVLQSCAKAVRCLLYECRNDLISLGPDKFKAKVFENMPMYKKNAEEAANE